METTRLNFKLSRKQHQQLKKLAEYHGLTMTTWLQVQIINQYENHKHKIEDPDPSSDKEKITNPNN